MDKYLDLWDELQDMTDEEVEEEIRKFHEKNNKEDK